MGRKAQILLGDLPFEHQPRLRHRSEHRMEGLARLEIHRAVLDLDDHRVGEAPAERNEFGIGLFRAVAVVVRSEERNVGKECGRTCRSWGEQVPYKKKK